MTGPTSDAWRIRVRPAERDVDAVRPERAPDAEDRMVRVGVDDPVVAFAGLRVVDRRVVEDVVGAERAHEVELGGAGDAGDLGAERLRDLDRERADVARTRRRSAPVARARACGRRGVAVPGSRGSRSAAGSPRPRTTARRDRQERLLLRAHVLGEGAATVRRTGRRRRGRPGLNRVTPGPTASTTPATSQPTR